MATIMKSSVSSDLSLMDYIKLVQHETLFLLRYSCATQIVVSIRSHYFLYMPFSRTCLRDERINE